MKSANVDLLCFGVWDKASVGSYYKQYQRKRTLFSFGSYVSGAGLELTMYQRETLNSWSSHLQLSSPGMTGVWLCDVRDQTQNFVHARHKVVPCGAYLQPRRGNSNWAKGGWE